VELRIGINNTDTLGRRLFVSFTAGNPQAWEGLAGRGLRAGRRNRGCRLCRLG
jgi:hypothetical protein